MGRKKFGQYYIKKAYKDWLIKEHGYDEEKADILSDSFHAHNMMVQACHEFADQWRSKNGENDNDSYLQELVVPVSVNLHETINSEGIHPNQIISICHSFDQSEGNVNVVYYREFVD